MRKSIAGRPEIRLMAQILLIATVIFSFVVINAPLSYAQDSGGGARARGRRRAGKAAPIKGRSLIAALSDGMSPKNVAKTKTVNIEKNVTDWAGKARRVQINKVEWLKTPGVRYYATIEGEMVDIIYLHFKAEKAALVSVQGAKPEQRLMKHYYSAKGSEFTSVEWWGQNRLLEETAIPTGQKTAVSFPQRYVNERALILLLADPILADGLKPVTVFSDDDSPRLGLPPIWGGLIPIEVYISCQINSKYLKDCDISCEGEQQQVPTGGLLGSGKGKLCRERGCDMCAGICCEPGKCSSETNPEPMFDCTFGAGSSPTPN